MRNDIDEREQREQRELEQRELEQREQRELEQRELEQREQRELEQRELEQREQRELEQQRQPSLLFQFAARFAPPGREPYYLRCRFFSHGRDGLAHISHRLQSLRAFSEPVTVAFRDGQFERARGEGYDPGEHFFAMGESVIAHMERQVVRRLRKKKAPG